VAVTVFQNAQALTRIRRRSGLRRVMQRKSVIAFLMTLPLILLVLIFVLYPALYSLHLATLNKSMERFVGFGNFEFLFRRETFWMVVKQSCIFAVTAVIFKAIFGFVIAHFVHNIPSKGQRKWRGMLLVPWVIPPAMSALLGCGYSIRPTARSTGCSKRWRLVLSRGRATRCGRAA